MMRVPICLFLIVIAVLLSLAQGDIAIAADRGAQVTTDGSADLFPAWSPDGTQIAFCSARSGTTEIWVIPSSGGAATRVTTTAEPGESVLPAWSPDGTLIAYSSGWESGNYDIWVIPSAGGTATRLTDDPAHDQMPDWSPDGYQIAFHSSRARDDHVYTMNDDGTGEAPLSTGQESQAPRWQPPGGNTIAYFCNQGGAYSIWRQWVSGGIPQHLIDVPGDQIGGFSWHPGGDTLAYASETSGNWDIWKVAIAGGPAVRVTTDDADDMFPAWSADGSLIAFCSDRSGNWDIWTCPPNDTPVEQQTWGRIKALFR